VAGWLKIVTDLNAGPVGPVGPVPFVPLVGPSSLLLSLQDANTSANKLKMTRPLLTKERRLTRFSFKAFIKYSP